MPQPGRTIYQERYEAARWRGTMADVLSLAQLVCSELARRGGRQSGQSLRIDFENGGHVSFDAVEQLVQSASTMDVASVRRIDIPQHAYNDDGDWLSMEFGRYHGLALSVHSADHVWALGLADLLREHAQRGEMPRFTGRWRPMKWWERLCVALFVSDLIATSTLAALQVLSPGYAGAIAWLGLFALIPLTGGGWRIENPPFKLLAEGTNRSAQSEPQPGLPVRVQDAIRKRPILSVVLAFLFAIAANKASELL